ncbi:stathmin domain-containing protein 1 isoform X3 [Rhinatrema bivittatum]|uniref:stathmin domain-containing protein 1 isoform X3 n=1 Tax=Rhinatrema bivittatum TaxID=194408 RepID=UPI00112A1D0D|nr:stathmin domain-containing protein 1 isoform X3 [Rhinatrema bivittatum]
MLSLPGPAAAQVKHDLFRRQLGPNARDGSALSKGTMDSGLGLEDELAGGDLPGTVTNKLSAREKESRENTDSMLFGDGLISKNGNLQERERQTSSDILKELMMQGIIQSQTRFVRNGEAYDVMVEPSEKPLRKPPVKLEKLKIKKKKKKTLTREDIENKMRAAEERRKVKEEALKKRLRSERPFPESTLQSIDELKGEELSLAEEGPEATVSTHPVTLESQLGERRIAMRALQILQETHSNSEDLDEIGALESDITYNTQHETGSDLKDDSF